MAWTDGIDRAANYIVTNTNWNDLLGAAGSLMGLKSHAHGGTTGEGSQSLGPLVLEDFTDAAAPAAPSAGRTRLYAVSGRLGYRPNGGSDTVLAADPTTTRGDVIYRGASALSRLAIGANGKVLGSNGTDPAWVDQAALTTAEAKLSGDVTMTTANTWYDGPSVSLAAGTWLIWAAIEIALGTITGDEAVAKLWDGTTAIDSGQFIGYVASAGVLTSRIPLLGLVVLGGTTTYKVSATSTGANRIMKAATTNNGSGNHATHIMAVKVA